VKIVTQNVKQNYIKVKLLIVQKTQLKSRDRIFNYVPRVYQYQYKYLFIAHIFVVRRNQRRDESTGVTLTFDLSPQIRSRDRDIMLKICPDFNVY